MKVEIEDRTAILSRDGIEVCRVPVELVAVVEGELHIAVAPEVEIPDGLVVVTRHLPPSPAELADAIALIPLDEYSQALASLTAMMPSKPFPWLALEALQGLLRGELPAWQST